MQVREKSTDTSLFLIKVQPQDSSSSNTLYDSTHDDRANNDHDKRIVITWTLNIRLFRSDNQINEGYGLFVSHIIDYCLTFYRWDGRICQAAGRFPPIFQLPKAIEKLSLLKNVDIMQKVLKRSTYQQGPNPEAVSQVALHNFRERRN